MKSRSHLFEKGQTLVEVMVALFVLTIGFLGVFSLISQSLSLSQTVSQQTTATYLASEGIELAKNIIDHDIYGNRAAVPGFTGWAKGGEDSTFQLGGDFELDYKTCNSLPTPSSPCRVGAYQGDLLGFDPTTGLYSYTGPNATLFTRDVRVTWQASNPNQMTVQSIVQWQSGATTQNVTMQDYFYNWQL